MRGKSASPEDTYRHLAVYTEVLSRIKSDYVEEPDMKSVTLGALNGLLESIDPYASYLNADQYKQWLKSKDQHKADVGLILSKKFGYVGIVDSIPGIARGQGRADHHRRSRNHQWRRDARHAAGLRAAAARRRSRQHGGTGRAAFPQARAAEADADARGGRISRRDAKMLPDQVGLIQAESLEGNRVKDIAAKVEDLQKQGAKQLVLDLRHCATGGPEAGEQLANVFLDKGLITYSEGQKVERHDVTADPANDRSHLPLAVIVDRGTADGAEIAAAALMDDKRAEVIGERTYGDASIRKPITDGRRLGRHSLGSEILFAVRQGHSGYRRHAIGSGAGNRTGGGG